MRHLWLAAAVLIAGTAHARAPPDADPALAPWFQDLRVPGSGTSCCSVADCRPAEYRTSGDHYEAFIDGQWLVVPPGRVLQRSDNPTGHAIVCYTPTLGILCFVRGPEV